METNIMDDKEFKDTLDIAVQTVLFGLYASAIPLNKTKIIRLKNVDFNKPSHLTILRIASMAQTIFGFQVEINMSKWKWFWKGGKYKNWCVRTDETAGLDVPAYIDKVEKRIEKPGILETVYFTYYKGV